jgi:hypothetical protein
MLRYYIRSCRYYAGCGVRYTTRDVMAPADFRCLTSYVGTPASLAIGVLTAAACNYATKLKILLRYDDTLDIFAVHGIGGFVGSLLTGIFADSRVAGFDGLTVIPGGCVSSYAPCGPVSRPQGSTDGADTC